MNAASAWTKPSAVYWPSEACSSDTTSATSADASSLTAAPALAPGTTTFTGPPIFCAAATASHDARLSTPSFCSAMTRIMAVLDDARVFAKHADEFLRGFGRRSGHEFGLFAFLGHVDRDNALAS